MTQVQSSFAPPQRLEAGEVAAQSRGVMSLTQLTQAFEAVNDLVVVLNSHRQILYANGNVLALLGAGGLDAILGRRPGEALGCQRSHECAGGCGTTKFCAACGAVKAILTAQAGRPDCRECSITREESGDALDLLVRTTPLVIDCQACTICAIRDIGHEKRRRALERIFFHDVLNTASGLLMFSQRVADGHDAPADRQRLHDLVTRMVDEIVAQRDLMAAETSELAVRKESFSVCEFLESVVQLYSNAPVCRNRWLLIEQCTAATIETDRHLLSRVLGNLVKNALEAAPENSTVDVWAVDLDGGIEFAVHNDGVIPPAVQLQLFQRSFSTKGAGRGLGTYSIKLLAERYLGGRVSLSSNADDGTTFRVWLPRTLG